MVRVTVDDAIEFVIGEFIALPGIETDEGTKSHWHRDTDTVSIVSYWTGHAHVQK